MECSLNMAKETEELEGKSVTCVLEERVKYCLGGGNLPEDLFPGRFPKEPLLKGRLLLGDSFISRDIY